MTTLQTKTTRSEAPPSTRSIGSTDSTDRGPEVFEETRTCDVHGEYTCRGFKPHRIIHWNECPQCKKIKKAEAEEERKKQEAGQREMVIRRRLGNSGLPPRFLGRLFENYQVENEGQRRAYRIAGAYADRFEDRLRQGGGLVLCGRPGTGKTHLAAAIANRVIHTGRIVAYMSVMNACRRIKGTWRSGSELTESQAYGAMLDPDLLILDEVGAQFGSETEKLILYEIINGRYEAMRPTILISNLSQNELGHYIGERAVDRMQEGGGAIVAFDWESYRDRVHKNDDLPVAATQPVEWKQY